MRKKRVTLLIILLLTVGFATVSTTLYLNGRVGIEPNKNNYIDGLVFDEESLSSETGTSARLSESGRTITFITQEMQNIDETATVYFKIKNYSQYNATLGTPAIRCYFVDEYTDDTKSEEKATTHEYMEIIPGRELDGDTIPSSGGLSDKSNITIKQIKSYIEDTPSSVKFQCEINSTSSDGDTPSIEKTTSLYNVTFNTDGGNTIDRVLEVKYKRAYGDLPTPTKENFKFAGWYTESGEKVDKYSPVNIKDNHTLIAKWGPACPYAIGNTWDFDYTGDEQKFVTPDYCDGTYRVELWGAQGGNKYGIAGGGYVKGNIELKNKKELFIYVGKTGTTNANESVFNYGIHNYSSTGGGATDIRLVNGTWNDLSSLTSRIMVAGGGGSNGGLNNTDGGEPYGGSAGGLVGYQGGTCISMNTTPYEGSLGATQTSGHSFGQIPLLYTGGKTNYNNSGGNGYWSGNYYDWTGIGGHNGVSGTGGGSSYISGHKGCVAVIDSTSTLPRKDSNKVTCEDGTTDVVCSHHYSKMIFTKTKMIDGEGHVWTTVRGGQEQMPNPAGGYYDLGIGHTGDGYARITLLSID